jgi:hypothetical protein
MADRAAFTLMQVNSGEAEWQVTSIKTVFRQFFEWCGGQHGYQ